MGRITREQLTFTNNELTGQTAEEVYQKWLENKDKPPLPTTEERLQIAEETIMFLLMNGGM